MMTYKGKVKTAPLVSSYSGCMVLYEGYVAKVLDQPYHISFLQSGKRQLLTVDEMKKYKTVIVEYEIDPASLDPKDNCYRYDADLNRYTKRLPLFNLQWQKVIDDKLLDTGEDVDFVSDGITSATVHAYSSLAYIIFNSDLSYSEEAVRQIARAAYEYGFKTGRATVGTTNVGTEEFNTSFEVALSGMMQLKWK